MRWRSKCGKVVRRVFILPGAVGSIPGCSLAHFWVEGVISPLRIRVNVVLEENVEGVHGGDSTPSHGLTAR